MDVSHEMLRYAHFNVNAVCSRAAWKTIKVWQIRIEIKLEAL